MCASEETYVDKGTHVWPRRKKDGKEKIPYLPPALIMAYKKIRKCVRADCTHARIRMRSGNCVSKTVRETEASKQPEIHGPLGKGSIELNVCNIAWTYGCWCIIFLH